MEFKSTHNLKFEMARWHLGDMFRVGTCEGLWGSTNDSYYILSIINSKPGNGHLNDVFEWFENSCKRDGRNLLVLECFNKEFYKHLTDKRGFVPLDNKMENLIKVFNKKAYKRLLRKGNSILHPSKLKDINNT